LKGIELYEEILTKQDAERLVADTDLPWAACPVYYQSFYDSIEDEAAEILGKCTVISIPLNGLTELSDAAAESLGKHEGKYISLNGLTELSDAAANSLGQHERILVLNSPHGPTTTTVRTESLALPKVDYHATYDGSDYGFRGQALDVPIYQVLISGANRA
jgi:hypothetical protein|tara:strand:+ start:98 stop:580 length:483 start_codon:yes stop_codon:yes gene_type:complete